jgi:hypothetical protein
MNHPAAYNKSFVEQELPDLAAVRAAGIELSLEDARVVLMVWSRLIAHGQCKSRQLPYVSARFVRGIVSAHVPVGPGEELAPLVVVESIPRIPDGKTVLKRLQLESNEISALWDASPTFATSCLPLELVLEFLPAGVWLEVAAFIACPQEELSPRIHEALRQHGRSAGPAPLRMDLTCLWRVMRILIALNRSCRLRTRAGRRRTDPASSCRLRSRAGPPCLNGRAPANCPQRARAATAVETPPRSHPQPSGRRLPNMR